MSESDLVNGEPGFINYCSVCCWMGFNSSCPNCGGDAGLKLYVRPSTNAKTYAELTERLESIHGRLAAEESAAKAELARLNPYASQPDAPPVPQDPVGRFTYGVRYYAGMLEDDDAWWHSLGHIEELCREFGDEVNKKAGKPTETEAKAERLKRAAELIAKMRECCEAIPSMYTYRVEAFAALDELRDMLGVSDG